MTRGFEPSAEDMRAFFNVKYYRFGEPAWGPRLRLSFDYFSPDDYYEAIVASLVTPGCAWVDIGCGRNIFPSYPELARQLAERCDVVYGIDPDANIQDNKLLTDRFQGLVEDCDTERRFDLVTLRMVAEHVVDPDRTVGKIAALTKPGGLVVVYTPNKWSPMSLVAAALPFRLHHPLKRLVWDGEARDTFPTAYKLNTHKALQHHLGRNGFEEVLFRYLDDCRFSSAYRWVNRVELTFRSALRAVGRPHVENCLLGIYRKRTPPA